MDAASSAQNVARSVWFVRKCRSKQIQASRTWKMMRFFTIFFSIVWNYLPIFLSLYRFAHRKNVVHVLASGYSALLNETVNSVTIVVVHTAHRQVTWFFLNLASYLIFLCFVFRHKCVMFASVVDPNMVMWSFFDCLVQLTKRIRTYIVWRFNAEKP